MARNSPEQLGPETTGPEKPIRTKEEVRELEDRLRFVARALSQNFDISVLPGDWWQTRLGKKAIVELQAGRSIDEIDPRLLVPEVIIYPQKHLLEKSEDFVWGALRHEVGHVEHTDFGEFMRPQELAKKEGYSPMDVLSLHNKWEDSRIDGIQAGDSETARYRMGVCFSELVTEMVLPGIEKKSLPVKFSDLCYLIGHKNFLPDLDLEEVKRRIGDQRVFDAIAETEEAFREFLQAPDGKKAFPIFWERCWPVYKRLIDQQIDEQAKKKFEESKEKSKAGQKPETAGEGASGERPKERVEGGKPQETDQESRGTTEPETGEGQGPKEDKSWEDLSEEEKDKFRQEARKDLDQEEKQSLEIILPKSFKIEEGEDGTIKISFAEISPEELERIETQERIRTEQEKLEKLEIEAAKAEQERKLRGQLAKLKERETGLTETERGVYDRYYQPVKKYIALLVERLDKIFPPTEESEWQGGYRRGKRIDTKRLAREIPTRKGEIFKRRETPEERQLAFTLLIDVSGSMTGQNIDQALKGAVLMAEALSAKGIPFEILGFQSTFFEIKGFQQEYKGKKRIQMVNEILSSVGGITDIGFAVDTASRRLQKWTEEKSAQGTLIVFTDGGPQPIPEHSGPEWDLDKIVKKWGAKMPLIGVGIGPGMEEMITQYFGKNGLPVPDVDKLPLALLRILERQVAKFELKSPSSGN